MSVKLTARAQISHKLKSLLLSVSRIHFSIVSVLKWRLYDARIAMRKVGMLRSRVESIPGNSYNRRHEISYSRHATRKEFLREILYNNIAIIAIQHSKIYFVDTFGDFSHTVEWNSLKSVWQISLYILA